VVLLTVVDDTVAVFELAGGFEIVFGFVVGSDGEAGNCEGVVVGEFEGTTCSDFSLVF
jgi:hypothetical protein